MPCVRRRALATLKHVLKHLCFPNPHSTNCEIGTMEVSLMMQAANGINNQTKKLKFQPLCDTKDHHCHHLWTPFIFIIEDIYSISRYWTKKTMIERAESTVPVYWELKLFTLLMKECILSGSFRKPSG